jgi:iron complex outermembrane receptor protein
VRGFEVPIYLDGLRLPVDPGTTFASQRLEPFGLERVEVLRGPSSGLYGQSPPGGLINAVSKRPQPVPFADLILSGGNFDRAQGSFDFNGPLESTGQWLVRMTGLVREAGTQLDFQRDNRYYFAPSLTWRPDADTSFTILASVQKSYGRGYQQYVPATGTVFPNPFGHIPYSRYLGEPDFDRFNTEHAAIGYSFEHRFNNYLQFRQNLRYSTASTNLQALRVDGVAPDQRTAIRTALAVKASTENLTVDNQLQLDVTTGPLQHKVLFGVDYYTQKGSSFFNMAAGPTIDLFAPVYGQAVAPVSTFATALDSRSNLQQAGIYLQDQITLDRLVLTATARADRADSTTTNLPTAFGRPKRNSTTMRPRAASALPICSTTASRPMPPMRLRFSRRLERPLPVCRFVRRQARPRRSASSTGRSAPMRCSHSRSSTSRSRTFSRRTRQIRFSRFKPARFASKVSSSKAASASPTGSI